MNKMQGVITKSIQNEAAGKSVANIIRETRRRIGKSVMVEVRRQSHKPIQLSPEPARFSRCRASRAAINVHRDRRRMAGRSTAVELVE